MKKTVKKITVLVMVFMTSLSAAASPDLQELLNKLKNTGSQTQTEGTTKNDTNQNTGSSTGGGLLDKLGALGSALGLIPEQTVDVAYLTGVWDYEKPAVAFQSDNFLQKAGGVAASAKIESELSTYYSRFGFDKVKMTFYPDSTFTMQMSRGSLKGTIEPSADNKSLTFNLKAFGKLPIGKMAVYVNGESKNQMTMTFDISKLISLMTKIGSVLNNSTINAVTKLLNSYDGMTAGFRLTRTSTTPPAKEK